MSRDESPSLPLPRNAGRWPVALIVVGDRFTAGLFLAGGVACIVFGAKLGKRK